MAWVWLHGKFGYTRGIGWKGYLMSETHGLVWWSELMTRDVAGALAYYGKVNGWSFDTMPMPDGSDYHLGKVGDRPVAGIVDMASMEGLVQGDAGWLTYFAVDDVDAVVSATTEAGGAIVVPPFEVPGVGRIVIVKDPKGAVVGMMTPADQG